MGHCARGGLLWEEAEALVSPCLLAPAAGNHDSAKDRVFSKDGRVGQRVFFSDQPDIAAPGPG